MDKLEYDSLHKFLVSLGLIFIALPFVVLYFFFSNDFTLISQKEFEELSLFSRNQLQQYECLMNIAIIVLPIICIVLFIAGIILLIIGIRNWKKVQKNLDAAIEADRIKHELDVSKMKNSEILERTIEEVKEAEPSNDTPVQSVIMRHMDIEDRYFSNALPKRIMRKYSFRRNVKIGRIEYDGIAVSSVDNTDIIFEIKYWKQPRTTQMLRTSIERLYNAGVNYEVLKHRNFRCVLAIITTLDNIGVMQKWVEHISHEESNYDFSKIEIQYVAEENI